MSPSFRREGDKALKICRTTCVWGCVEGRKRLGEDVIKIPWSVDGMLNVSARAGLLEGFVGN
eukprot:scaffold34210_cov49-Attheya_sp.AAC.3